MYIEHQLHSYTSKATAAADMSGGVAPPFVITVI